MSDGLKDCCFCKAGNLNSFIKIYCNHIACPPCYKQHKKENYIECKICKHNYNTNFCTYITKEPQPTKCPESQTKTPPRYESEFNTIKKEIIQLEDLINKIKSIHTECETNFYQDQAYMNFIFDQFKCKIESVHDESLSKLKQVKEGNQKYLNEYQDYIQFYIKQRKDIIGSIEKSWKTEENNDLSKEFNELIQFNMIYLQISRCKYKNDFQEIFDQILNTFNALFEFYIEDVPIQFLDMQEIEKTLKEEENKKEENLRILSHMNEKNDFFAGFDLENNLIKEKIELSKQKIIEAVVNEKITCLNDKNDLRPLSLKQNAGYYRRGKKDYFGSNEKSRLGSKAEWFIQIGEIIKELPQFVCDQINRYREYKNTIYIEKDGETINFVDLDDMLYYKVLSGQKTNPHRLIYLPKE